MGKSFWSSRSRIVRRALMLAALQLALSLSVGRAQVYEAVPVEKAGRELIVGLMPGTPPTVRAAVTRNASFTRPLSTPRFQGRFRAAAPLPETQVIHLEEEVDLAGELARLRQNPAVTFVEPNYPLHLFQIATPPPNDFSFSSLDNLANTGQNGGTPGADIDALGAWSFSTGQADLRVAVIDTGVDYLHEDLAPNIWVNPGEIPGNGLDDDRNGYIDDVHGYDFVSDDSDPIDDMEHGTHVAGILGARGNNEIGVVGVCWEVSLMALKSFNERGEGRVSDAVEAIHYAVDNGAKIINASWGLSEKSFALEQAVQYAAQSGLLVIAAAGNSKTDAPSYPAAYEEVLSVAATDARDLRALFSNYGPEVDLAAPGQNIYSTLPENSYGAASGTSMAAPHVSGVAALILSRFPHYEPEDVRDILLNSADAIKTDRFIGRGRLNAAVAVQMDQPLPRARLAVADALGGEVEVHGTAAGIFFNGYSLFAGSGEDPEHWVQIGSGIAPVSSGLLGHFNTSVLPDGPAIVRLVVTNQTGEIAVDLAKTEIRNTAIKYPMGGDVLRAGASYEVRGTSFGTTRQYYLFIGQGVAPKEWVEIASGPSRLEEEIILGTWDTATFEPNQFYSIKLATTDGVTTNEYQERLIFLDGFLKDGWPHYAYADKDLSVGDWRNLRAADLDQDGQSEFVIVEPANAEADGLLKVLDVHGQVVWTASLEGANPDIPAIGDVDGNGQLEVFAEAGSQVHAFNSDGTPLGSEWPVSVAAGDLAKVLADVNHDGRLELITYSQDWVMANGEEVRELTVFDHAGAKIRQWQLPWCGFTNEVQKIFPAVANLDEDENLEIVVVSGCNEIACYDLESDEPVWISAAEGALVSSPVIGDLDGNGELDIIVAAAQIMGFDEGGVHAFTASGQLWNGWPALEQSSFFNPPALGDLNLDGRLEIAIITKSDYSLHVLESDGFHAEGWPVRLSRFVLNSSPTIGDVDADGYPDVLFAALGAPDIAPLEDDPTWVGGVQAWKYDGRQIDLSPGAGNAFPIEVTNLRRYEKAASPILLDADGNGKLDLVATSVYERSYGTAPFFKYRSSLYAWELPVNVPPRGLDWPMFGQNPANSGTYALPLVPTNTGPWGVTLALRDRIALAEDTPTLLHVLDNDLAAEGTSIRLVRITQPEHGLVTQATAGVLYFTPEPDFSGLDEFTYTIRDTTGAESTASVLLKVKFVNDPPVAVDQELEMFKNGAVNITYLAEDDEDSRLTFKIVQGPRHGELWNYPTVGNYQPFKGFFGTDSFSYTAHDGRKESLPATVTIHVINSNNPPRAIEQTLITKPNRPLAFSPFATDPDGDPLTFEITTQPLQGTIEGASPSFRYTPASNYVGADSFFFRAFDGTEYSAEAKITVNITVTNSTPVATGSTITIPPNGPSPIPLNASDVDGDALTYILLTEPQHGVLTGNPPEFTYTPVREYLGPDRFSFMVSDGQAESAPAEVSILVARVNHPPGALAMSLTTVTNTPLAFEFQAEDQDGDPLRALILKGTTHGRLYGLDTSFTYVPERGFRGLDSFTYKIWDGARYSAAQTVTIFVAAPAESSFPFLESITVTLEGAVQLQVSVQAQVPFRIEGSTNLVDWLDLSGVIIPKSQTYNFLDQGAADGQRYYRAVATPQ